MASKSSAAVSKNSTAKKTAGKSTAGKSGRKSVMQFRVLSKTVGPD